ncbi:translation initiation factor IF-2-like isoform X1 [Harpia harpyja]|uniref:translation initiation factor IF-2-like isoform X1 n=1 Tax=Harpia harpyja TaxID=202280 RepID=UPI0022B10FA6|nr:translation initiation factor IF-2-like isoform X1 [Harpia harpyja]
MPRNVEVKARLRALEAARAAAERLGGPGRARGTLQADTFFRVPRGRLKLRRGPDGRGELIFYERPDATGPKLSRFTITPTDDPDGLELLSRYAGSAGAGAGRAGRGEEGASPLPRGTDPGAPGQRGGAGGLPGAGGGADRGADRGGRRARGPPADEGAGDQGGGPDLRCLPGPSPGQG